MIYIVWSSKVCTAYCWWNSNIAIMVKQILITFYRYLLIKEIIQLYTFLTMFFATYYFLLYTTFSPPIWLPYLPCYSNHSKWCCFTMWTSNVKSLVQHIQNSHPNYVVLLTSYVFSEQCLDFYDNLQQAVRVNWLRQRSPLPDCCYSHDNEHLIRGIAKLT